MPPAVLRGPAHSSQASQVAYDPWIEHLAWLMDSSIGIGRWSIGLDGLLGLIPGFGDAAGAVISMLIVVRAVKAGVPRIAAARMIANIGIDALVGTVPIVGDLFDFAFKANEKNVRIYKEMLHSGRASTVRHWVFFVVLALALAMALAIPVLAIVYLLHAVF